MNKYTKEFHVRNAHATMRMATMPVLRSASPSDLKIEWEDAPLTDEQVEDVIRKFSKSVRKHRTVKEIGRAGVRLGRAFAKAVAK